MSQGSTVPLFPCIFSPATLAATSGAWCLLGSGSLEGTGRCTGTLCTVPGLFHPSLLNLHGMRHLTIVRNRLIE